MHRPTGACRADGRPDRHRRASAVLCTVVVPASVTARTVSTTSTIQRLERIQNMRDLSEAHPGIQPGRVFRGACPNVASTADVRVLREELGIQQLVRLQSALVVTVACQARACAKRPLFCRRKDLRRPQAGDSLVASLGRFRRQTKDGNRAACRNSWPSHGDDLWRLFCLRSNRALDTGVAAHQPLGRHHLVSRQRHG